MWATRASWERMQILVIDEIGMAAASFLDAISSEIATMRGEYDKAFGGIQLVFCGDFGQLGPIEDEQASSGQQAAGEARPFVNTGLAFQARMWRAACFEVVRLNTVYRQDEKAFVDALNHLRDGNVPPEAVTLFGKTCAVPLHLRESASESASQSADLAVEATQLHAKNSAVDKVNTDRLQRLPGAVTVFVAIDTVQAGCATADPSRLPCLTNAERAALERSDFFKVCLAPQELQLKIGAQVMLLKNLDLKRANTLSPLGNGSQGVVIGFDTWNEQNALDRKVSAASLAHVGGRYPKVRFSNGRVITVWPALFSSEVRGVGICIREQVPLKLSWAMTIHKSQGMTLDMVHVDLSQVFADGHAYVALSRARNVAGLYVQSFHPTRVHADQRVIQFHAQGMNAETAALWNAL